MRAIDSRILRLPAKVFEADVLSFIGHLGSVNQSDSIEIDFSRVEFYIPAAIVALITKIHGWLAQEKRVTFSNHRAAKAGGYLQRMDFFKHCGIDNADGFERHDPSGRFVPIHAVRSGSTDVARVSGRVAECIAPDLAQSSDPNESGPFDYVEYAISELASNVIQHSGAYGFILAQHTPTRDTTRLAIADCGIGNLNSFERMNSPHWDYFMNDVQAIHKALEPRVSSKSHLQSAWGESVNAGVGLTLLKELSQKVGGGFMMISGSGFVSLGKSALIPPDRRFDGTMCAISFPRSAVRNFFDLIYDAKSVAGLLGGRENRLDLSGLFE